MDNVIDLSGKVALVTGGARGIGRSICERLTGCGARVAVCDISVASAERAAVEIGGGALAFAVDVGNELSCVECVDSVVQETGGIDILVNNAGIGESVRGTLKQNVEEWRQVIDVNLQGVYVMARLVARQMIAMGTTGTIINMSSITGLMAHRASNGYGVSKAAVAMLTQTLASDLAGKNIRVNAIAPGVIQTDMARKFVKSAQTVEQAFLQRIPMGSFGKPDDIARVTAFLASDWAGYLTGAVIPVDGGWCAFGGPSVAG